MYEFKKTDSKELERTITILLAVFMIAMPVSYSLQFFGIVDTGRVLVSEVVLVISAVILAGFDMAYVFRKENRGIRLFDIIALLMIVSVVISTMFANNIKLALGGNDITGENTMALIAFVLIGYSASLITDDKNRKIIYAASVIFGLIQVVMGLSQTLFITPRIEELLLLEEGEIPRAIGTVKNANPYGNLMVLLTGLECGLVYSSKGFKGKALHGILVVLYMLCLLLSGTRGAYVGFFGAAFVMCIVLIVKTVKTKQKLSKTFFNLGIVLLLVVVAAGIYLLTSMGNLKDVANRTSADVANGGFGEYRALMWKRAIDEFFLERPVIGCGPSNVSFAFFTGNIFMGDASGELVFDIHNKYLNIMCTQGIVGLLLYLALLFICAFHGFKKLHVGNQDACTSYIAFCLALLGFAFSDFFCIGMACMRPYFYILLGMMCSRNETVKMLGKKKNR